jgi:chaperone modulatory protein CbpM
MNNRRCEITFHYSASESSGSRLLHLAELAGLAGLHPEVVKRFLALGLIEPAVKEPEPLFGYEAVLRVGRIVRLRRDMGINLASAGIILDLLDQIEELKTQLEQLKRW